MGPSIYFFKMFFVANWYFIPRGLEIKQVTKCENVIFMLCYLLMLIFGMRVSQFYNWNKLLCTKEKDYDFARKMVDDDAGETPINEVCSFSVCDTNIVIFS